MLSFTTDDHALSTSTQHDGQTAAVWWLEHCANSGEGVTSVPLVAFPFRIGRSEEMGLTLHCRTVSGTHAEIQERGGALLLSDLNSTNGTFINGQRLIDPVPLADGDLLQFGRVALRLTRTAATMPRHTAVEDVCDKALALTQFEKLMNERAVVPFFQPITDRSGTQVFAFEVLGRSRMFGLHHPREMFEVASQLNVESQLSRMMRDVGVEFGNSIYNDPHLFLNTHPSELADRAALIDSLAELRTANPSQPITLEIHEGAVTDPAAMKHLHSALRDLNIGLAYDDFGAGQARLAEIVDVSPDYLKFDMGLIQGIHQAPTQRKLLLKRLVDMVRELNITPLAEGVECVADHDTCCDLGFDLFQGFLFGRPAAASTFVFEDEETPIAPPSAKHE